MDSNSNTTASTLVTTMEGANVAGEIGALKATPAEPTTTATPNSTASLASDQHLLLEVIFFLCTILDTIIVQPILFITSDDNVSSLPFYIS